MALIKRKPRKKMIKHIRKLIKKHGPEVTLSLVTGLITDVASTTDGMETKQVKKRLKQAQDEGAFLAEAPSDVVSSVVEPLTAATDESPSAHTSGAHAAEHAGDQA